MKISGLKSNEKNPRTIRDGNFEKLCKSIEQFPKMMQLRPIVVNEYGVILGGNMRFRALIKLGYKNIPDNWVKVATDLTDDEQRRFIIEDNVAFGDWDWETLANEWNVGELMDWGLEIPQFDQDDADTTGDSNSVNLSIKCDDDDQLAQLQKRLNIKSKSIEYSEFIGFLDGLNQ